MDDNCHFISRFFMNKSGSSVHYYDAVACGICSCVVQIYHFRRSSTYEWVKFQRPVRKSVCNSNFAPVETINAEKHPNNSPPKAGAMFYHFLTSFKMLNNVSTVTLRLVLLLPATNTFTCNCTYGQVCLYLWKFTNRGVPIILFSFGNTLFSSKYFIDCKYISKA